MKLSEVKSALKTVDSVTFSLPNGATVPEHFHVTEVGQITRNFIDCGGTKRNDSIINFQLWTAHDYDHRLSTEKLTAIIELSEKELGLEDLEVEVEYQSDTIGKYKLEFEEGAFQLKSTQTDCLAQEQCGIPVSKPKIRLSNLTIAKGSCEPGSGCC